ncbi:MAG: hypothetical protein FJ357_01320 [Thaumarchaeota archaeon]|nr:hypothetical protein [Nitrososphaerota archaeon]
MKTILAFVFSIALALLLVTSHATAMEEKPSSSDKMTEKKMSEKMADKKKDKKMDDKKKDIKKKTTKKKMTDKKMTDKMADHKMSDKPKMIGGIDVSMASPIQGSAYAKVTIIEFGDYQCPKCYSWFTKEKPTIESQYIAPGKANLVFVDLSFLGPDSDSAVIASYCADE